MKIACPKCKAKLVVPDEKLKAEGAKFKCSKCGTVIVYKGKARKPPAEDTAVSEPATSPAASVVAETASPPPEEEQEMSSLSRSSSSALDPGLEAIVRQIKDTPGPEPLVDEGEEIKAAAATETVKQFPPPVVETRSGPPLKVILIGAGIGILVIVLIAVFFFRSGKSTPQDQPSATVNVAPPVSQPLPQTTPPAAPPAASSPAVVPGSPPPPAELPSQMTDDKAIDMVKRSDALLKRTPVNVLINNWTTDNAAKYKIVGWQVKKMDEQKYLVSYTALDGDKPIGFYFDLDAKTGAVQDISKNPDLQKQYNIQYGR